MTYLYRRISNSTHLSSSHFNSCYAFFPHHVSLVGNFVVEVQGANVAMKKDRWLRAEGEELEGGKLQWSFYSTWKVICTIFLSLFDVPYCSFIRSFVCLFIFVRSFVHSFIRSFVWSIDRSFVRSFDRSFVRLFVRSSVRSLVRSFIHSKFVFLII